MGIWYIIIMINDCIFQFLFQPFLFKSDLKIHVYPPHDCLAVFHGLCIQTYIGPCLRLLSSFRRWSQKFEMERHLGSHYTQTLNILKMHIIYCVISIKHYIISNISLFKQIILWTSIYISIKRKFSYLIIMMRTNINQHHIIIT